MSTNREVLIKHGTVTLVGDLILPEGALGLVIFAHGSGSSRFSGRNRAVAGALNAQGLATLLLDLLTTDEESRDALDGHLRFDIALLGERVVAAVDWSDEPAETSALPVGLFGASTGGGAALVAAAARPQRVRAVVSRGGRPDLAAGALPLVRAPTLLIVGERDDVVVELNRQAAAQMRTPTRIEIVPGATHLFGEPGALEKVARLASEFFLEELGKRE